MNHPTQPTGPYGQPAQPPEPSVSRRAVRIAWMIGGGLLVFGLGATAGAAGSGGDSNTATPAETITVTAPAPEPEPAKTVTVTATPKPKPKPKPAGPPTEFGDGIYKVGTDVAAGTYRTAGPAESAIPNCYWSRNKDASGEFDSIIANDNSTGPTTVTIKTGEYIETNGCKQWKKVG